ncbi:acyl-CoA reductase-like NAD-dependent aldehyde dehydrogenase [Neobacillus niacini]|uniref:aldehyde dehydrogenase family protein n=1 Tax=Neobacillus niacini TaxID=86668 RepID=UPI00278504D0|nr:aldehyde dehydrogenase family protein [Neobacillus niacini]MDQ1002203.1 acyl-CoA reductase-like NAD-dependent aldehyde dehydrogenase [Neobacillus niacini]
MIKSMDEFTLTINGKQIETKETIGVINPATEEIVGHAPVASKNDLDLAVKAARSAFPKWASRSFEERSELILQFANAISENQKELASLLTLEQGKPLSFAEREINMAVYWLKESANHRLSTEVLEESETTYIEKHYTPLGVVGAIVPWNFPVLLAMFKIPLALLSGNTLIVKPSPYTPLTTLKIGEIASTIFPDGVYNTLSGDDALGPMITGHPGIDKVSFTGSTATGKKIMESAAKNLKRVTLELGGNDAAIILPDVSIDEVIQPIFWGMFLNSGQVCINAKRIFVHHDIYDKFVDKLIEYAKTVRVGNGLEPASQLGPVQNLVQYKKVKNLIKEAKQNGLKFAFEGEAPRSGYFIPVTIVDNPPENARVVTEEAFGPIVPLLKYQSYEEVIERANRSQYGLGGSIWGKDIELAKSIADKLETGTVWINEIGALSPTIPFGGHKQSGYGIEGSVEGLKEYTNTKIIRINKR